MFEELSLHIKRWMHLPLNCPWFRSNSLRYLLSLSILLLLAGISSIEPASFDCAKASTRTEKMICANASISAADEKLAQAYRDAKDKALNRPLLVEEQRDWFFKRNDIVNEADLLKFYGERIRHLQMTPRAGRVRFEKNNCSDFLQRNRIEDVADCRVSNMGTIDTMGPRTYGYAIYYLVSETPVDRKGCNLGGFSFQTGLAVYMREKGSKENRLILERAECGLIYHVPEIISNSYGTFLYLPMIVYGMGRNENEYYLWNRSLSEWTLLDVERLLKDLEQKLPLGLATCEGIWPDIDIKMMTADADLYRRGDGNCCRTGGTANMRLALEGKRFKIESVAVSAGNRKQVD